MAGPLTEASLNFNSGASRGVGSYGAVGLERFDEKTGALAESVRFEGRILGSASSEHANHRNHDGLNWAPKRVKCSACRWLEVTIYRRRTKVGGNCALCHGQGYERFDGVNVRCPDCTDPKGQFVYDYDYVIHTVGVSEVPGEIDFVRIHQTSSAFEVVELLTVRRPNLTTGQTDAYMPPQHAMALAQAAILDEDLQEAYVNRAVA